MPNKGKFRWLPVEAQVVEATATDVERASNVLRQAGHKEAALSPVGDNGKPRMLIMKAWIAHAGKPNRNRDAFKEEDLQAAVEAGLFKAPFLGMIDFNHDFTAYGAWYDAKWLFDEAAGLWGIQAEGAIFAWRYEELADRVMAMQVRLGHVEFSMACMAGDYEIGVDTDGPFFVLRNPVFFTTSVLDVDPADPDAKGLVSEKPEDLAVVETELAARLALASISQEDNNMDEQIIAKIKELLGTEFEQYVDQFAAAFAAVETLATVQIELATAKETIAALTVQVEELTNKVAETSTNLETVSTEKAELQVALDATKVELENVVAEKVVLETFKATIEEEIAAKELITKRTARLDSLSEAAQAGVAAMEEVERNRLLDMWVAMEDEVWAQHVKVMNIGKGEKKVSLVERSILEGAIGGGKGGQTALKIDQYFN